MKKFNITGTCIPHLHYMVNIDSKLSKVIELVNEGNYFIISRPRQYGKTSLLSALYRKLNNSDSYLLIKISFEGLGDESFENVESFARSFLLQISEELKKERELLHFIQQYKPIQSFKELDIFLSELVSQNKKKVLLIIDEVDKASNFSLFISFLGILRDKYLKRADGLDETFHSVILAGLHDIKNIKKRIHSNSMDGWSSVPSYNSPWNIATEFDLDMSFSAKEIETMLVDYFKNGVEGRGEDRVQGIGSRVEGTEDEGVIGDFRLSIESSKTSIANSQHPIANIQQLSQEIYKFTSGYPFLVSKICKVIDEKLEKDWTTTGIKNAISRIINEQNTLFDDMVKNIENRQDLYQLTQTVLLDNVIIDFNLYNPTINYGVMYGIFSQNNNKLRIANKIFEIFLYNYMTSKLEVSNVLRNKNSYVDNYLHENGDINMECVLLKFQEFIQNIYSEKDIEFYERQGRLLLVAFLKPIINGSGFYYIEPQQSYERRVDMIITHNKKEYILEFKLWYGEKYHLEGLKQLAGYLESRSQSTGYLVVFNFNKNKEFTNQWNEANGKKIFEVIV